jgi:peptide chain release factor subunit 1
MLTPEHIAELEAFDAGEARVLSVYLDLDPARRVRRAYQVVFDDLVKEASARLADPSRADLLRETSGVRAWLGDREPPGKGLALFSCSSPALWQVHALAVRIRDHLAFEPHPDVAPLLELVDEYERYAVALVDKERARLFTVFLGEIEEIDAFQDSVPAKHDQGGISQAKYQHHHDVHVHWHLARVARGLAELLRRRWFDRLVLAGPQEATSELRRRLPRMLAHRLAGVIPAALSASDAEILEKTLAIERQVERQVEERLLEELFDRAAPGGRATVGVVPTLDALWADVVRTLVVADGLHLSGSECANCGRLELPGTARCPACGKAMRPVHDLLHRAMARALEQAGTIEVVHGDAARRLVEAGGGLGALLRYQVSAASGTGR